MMLSKRELLDDLATLSREELADVLAHLSPDEVAALDAILNPSPPPRPCYVPPPKPPFRELVSAGTKAGMARLREGNRRYTRYPAIGHRFVRLRYWRRTFHVPDWNQLRFVPLIVEWRERDGLGWQEMSNRIEAIEAAEQNRKPRGEITPNNRLWNRMRCKRVYERRDALLADWQKVQDQAANLAADIAEGAELARERTRVRSA